MKRTYIIAAVIGLAAGYFGSKTLRGYSPFNKAFAFGASKA